MEQEIKVIKLEINWKAIGWLVIAIIEIGFLVAGINGIQSQNYVEAIIGFIIFAIVSFEILDQLIKYLFRK